MSDDPKLVEQDGKLISLSQAHELAYWTKALGCTEAELRAAVAAAGNSAKAVRLWLAANRK